MTPPLEPTRGLAEIFSAFSDAEATRNVLFRLEQHAPSRGDVLPAEMSSVLFIWNDTKKKDS